MVDRAGIDHRWSVLPPETGGTQPDVGGFYDHALWLGTAQRMSIYAREAPMLAARAITARGDHEGVTHLLVASCTGFVAPDSASRSRDNSDRPTMSSAR